MESHLQYKNILVSKVCINNNNNNNNNDTDNDNINDNDDYKKKCIYFL